jgi:hypothetical protein
LPGPTICNPGSRAGTSFFRGGRDRPFWGTADARDQQTKFPPSFNVASSTTYAALNFVPAAAVVLWLIEPDDP